LAIGVVEIVGALRYKEPDRKRQRDICAVPLRRDAIRGVLSTAALLLFSLRLPRAEAQMAEHKLQKAGDNPLSPDSAQTARDVLAAAKATDVKIQIRVIKDTGARFLEIANQNPEAWSTVQEYLSYRSVINVDLYPRLTPATGKSNYRSSVTISALPPHQGYEKAYGVYFAGGYATGDKSARLENLKNPQSQGSEFAFFIIDGGADTIALDDSWMRNVIIRNCNLSYAGGRVRLENVWFVNCTFYNFEVTPEVKQLGAALLAHAPVTFAKSA